MRVRVGEYRVRDESELMKAIVDSFDKQGIMIIRNESGRQLLLTIKREKYHIELSIPSGTKIYRYPKDPLFISVHSHGTFSIRITHTEASDKYIMIVNEDEEVVSAHIGSEITIVAGKYAVNVAMEILKTMYPDLELAGIMGKE